ncbi:hypothetical protein BaRGS_00023080 [Batillaria attramentaria]|uniref:BZIP domain-containing protein n=1 Tax=Batillaria attramentaria TaxID=370345 RepID=A0ABD0KF19_9CAEN
MACGILVSGHISLYKQLFCVLLALTGLQFITSVSVSNNFSTVGRYGNIEASMSMHELTEELNHMKRESSESDADKPSTSSGIPQKGKIPVDLRVVTSECSPKNGIPDVSVVSKMAFEKTQKRVGKRPGRKPSKIDQKAKLERSRQSARECRARKKLRYQYLEELVASREKAVFSLRDEVEMYKKWCSDLDRGIVPEGLLKMIAQDEMRNAMGQAPTVAQSKGSNLPVSQMDSQTTQASQSSLTAMHRFSRSFEESASSPAHILVRQRSGSAPNLAGTSSDNSSHMFVQQPATQASVGSSGAGITALVYQDFARQTDSVQKASDPNTGSFQSAYHAGIDQGRLSTTASTVLQVPTTASWGMRTVDGQYASRQLPFSRASLSSTFGGSNPTIAQSSQRVISRGGNVGIPVTTLQPTSSNFSQSSVNSFTSSRPVLAAGNVHTVQTPLTIPTMLPTPSSITRESLAPLVNAVVTCGPAASTTQETVSVCPSAELTASISEPIPHWYSFLDDLESVTFSRQGAFSGENTPTSVGTPSSVRSNRSGPGTPSGIGTPASVGSPYPTAVQAPRQQQQQQQTGDAGNIPTVITELLGHHSPS